MKIRPRTLSFSLHSLLVLFLSIGVVFFIGLGLNLLFKVEEVNQAAAAQRLQDAQMEITRALEQLMQNAEELGLHFSAWDEVQQQLLTPTYYAYWREQRMQKATRLPNYVMDIELYNMHGNALIRPHTSSLPAPMPTSATYIAFEDGNPYLYRFTPVFDRIEPEKTIGYTGIKIDVLTALLSLYHFSHTQANSIHFTPFTEHLTESTQLLQYLEFKPLPSPQSSNLETLIKWNLLHFSILVAGLIVLMYFLFSYFLKRPLATLVQQINTLRNGNPTPLLESEFGLSVKEIDTLKESLVRYQHDLDKVHSKLDRQNVELWRLAHHDPLTGTYNRRAFDDDWHNLTELFQDQRISISYMLFDCDHFKAINDTYGHQIGDELIKIIAINLQKCLRKGDKLYRLGGDEFAAIIINTPPQAVSYIAERCLKVTQFYPFKDLGINEPVTISIGIANAEGTDLNELKALPRHADLAMYHAKKSAVKIQTYTPQMGEDAAIFSSHIVNAVLNAVEHTENILPYYQGIHHCTSNSVSFYEALVRIKNIDGVFYPGDIFPVINRHSLDAEFDHAIIAAIQRDLEADLIPEGTGVSINLSAATLIQTDLDRQLVGLLPYLHSHTIVLEVTETSLISHLNQATDNLLELQRLGFIIALDDFGSGYSSIRYLANMPVDIVKFDIAMIQTMKENPRNRKIVEHIAKMIRDAGYQLVAEGIEDQTTLELVVEMGATHVQGYYIDKPVRPLPHELPKASAQ
jgi:diguanylate cyclase (GGDEF)-like protein